MSAEIATSAVQCLSSVHGRERRAERAISKRDLRAAVKYGKKESAGGNRWMYTFADVVYITDHTSSQEITSWAVPGAGIDLEKVAISPSIHLEHIASCKRIADKTSWTSHTIVVVDQSGSMRKTDVGGGVTRSDAVWVTLALDFVMQQLKTGEKKSTDVLSVIGMRSESKILIDCQPYNLLLFNTLVDLLRSSRASSHGNYLPSLALADELLNRSQGSTALLLLFMSDGRPSDSSCGHGGSESDITAYIASLGSRFGRRLTFAMVGLGNFNVSDFLTLKRMADAAKQFSCHAVFQKPQWTAESLGICISSLASSVTATKLELTCLASSVQREVRHVPREPMRTPDELVYSAQTWHKYPLGYRKVHGDGSIQTSRVKWSIDTKSWQYIEPCSGQAVALAMRKNFFGEGAERLVRKFREVNSHGDFVGPLLVAKESRFLQDLENEDLRKFHRTFCETQTRAQQFADKFNAKLETLPGVDNRTPRISFLECSVYMVNDQRAGRLGLLVEKMLDVSEYKKWNSNCGFVADRPETAERKNVIEDPTQLQMMLYDEDGADDSPSSTQNIVKAQDVPQAFSHFTYRFSDRKLLVCDLQGVLNVARTPPEFELTDPVIHHKNSIAGQARYGRTDKGLKGFHDFFKTHECSDLCRMLKPRRVVRATR